MTNQEIFTMVKSKKEKIDELFDPTVFVFNPEVARLEKEISDLQEMCKHEYENGVCKYCQKEKE